MPGVISTLDPELGARVLTVRSALEEEFAFKDGVIGEPHLTYHLARDYCLPQVEAALAGLAGTSRPFRVRAAGLATFRNPHASVIYVPVEPTPELLALQAAVTAALADHCDGIGAHFTPQAWAPHLSLAILPGEAWPLAAMLAFARERLEPWAGRLDNLTLMRDGAGRGDWVTYPLAG